MQDEIHANTMHCTHRRFDTDVSENDVRLGRDASENFPVDM